MSRRNSQTGRPNGTVAEGGREERRLDPPVESLICHDCRTTRRTADLWWCRDCGRTICSKCNIVNRHNDHRSAPFQVEDVLRSAALALDYRCSRRSREASEYEVSLKQFVAQVENQFINKIQNELARENSPDRRKLTAITQILGNDGSYYRAPAGGPPNFAKQLFDTDVDRILHEAAKLLPSSHGARLLDHRTEDGPIVLSSKRSFAIFPDDLSAEEFTNKLEEHMMRRSRPSSSALNYGERASSRQNSGVFYTQTSDRNSPQENSSSIGEMDISGPIFAAKDSHNVSTSTPLDEEERERPRGSDKFSFPLEPTINISNGPISLPQQRLLHGQTSSREGSVESMSRTPVAQSYFDSYKRSSHSEHQSEWRVVKLLYPRKSFSIPSRLEAAVGDERRVAWPAQGEGENGRNDSDRQGIVPQNITLDPALVDRRRMNGNQALPPQQDRGRSNSMGKAELRDNVSMGLDGSIGEQISLSSNNSPRKGSFHIGDGSSSGHTHRQDSSSDFGRTPTPSNYDETDRAGRYSRTGGGRNMNTTRQSHLSYYFGEDFLTRPLDVASLSGDLWAVSDSCGGIYIVNSRGDVKKQIPTEAASASSIAYCHEKGLLYVSLLRKAGRSIAVFSVPEDYRAVQEIPCPVQPEIDITRARWIAVTKMGDLYLTSGDNEVSAIWKFRPETNNWLIVKEERKTRYQYLQVTEEDERDNFLVLMTTEGLSANVLLFVVGKLGVKVWSEHNISQTYHLHDYIQAPCSAVSDSKGNLVVLDYRNGNVWLLKQIPGNNRVRAIRSLAQFGAQSVLGADVNNEGWLFVATLGRKRIQAIHYDEEIEPYDSRGPSRASVSQSPEPSPATSRRSRFSLKGRPISPLLAASSRS